MLASHLITGITNVFHLFHRLFRQFHRFLQYLCFLLLLPPYLISRLYQLCQRLLLHLRLLQTQLCLQLQALHHLLPNYQVYHRALFPLFYHPFLQYHHLNRQVFQQVHPVFFQQKFHRFYQQRNPVCHLIPLNLLLCHLFLQ